MFVIKIVNKKAEDTLGTRLKDVLDQPISQAYISESLQSASLRQHIIGSSTFMLWRQFWRYQNRHKADDLLPGNEVGSK